MLGIEELKENIEITNTTVECPVKNCDKIMKRQRKAFKREERFKCPTHDIYISPSTFEYKSELDNLLWKDENDLNLFNNIKEVKRESRIARDNSEDAVTWNVFRFLEKQNLINAFLSDLIEEDISKSDIMYWAFSQEEGVTWSGLSKARNEFETRPDSGSEPDLIINTNRTLFFIEAKLTDRPKTPNKVNFNKVVKKYSTGGNSWFSTVFKKGFNFEEIAYAIKNYQLVRFWLIGSWIANEKGKDFILYNLVREEDKKYYENKLNKYILEKYNRRYFVISWEDIYRYLLKNSFDNKDKDIILDYFRNKTIGYTNSNAKIGYLQKAFSL